MAKAAIAVRQLTKKYDEGSSGTLALRGIDLDVHAGELLMLVGPSGSGKTTLLSLMGCILTATSGSIRIAGKEIVGLNALRFVWSISASCSRDSTCFRR